MSVDPDTQRSVTWIFGLLGLVEQAIAAAVFAVPASQWLVLAFFGCIIGGEASARIIERQGVKREGDRGRDG